MFSLIITIISVALVAALALATLYYGGDTFNQGRADAQAAQILNQGQQVLGAAELYYLKNSKWPERPEDLVEDGFLESVPVAQGPMSEAHAQAARAWVMPTAGVPVFTLPNVETDICKMVNKKTYGLDGVLKQAYTSLSAQCYGTTDNAYTVVVSKGGDKLPDGLPVPDVSVTPALPAPTDTAAWDQVPGTQVGGGSTPPGGGGTGGGSLPEGTDAAACLRTTNTTNINPEVNGNIALYNGCSRPLVARAFDEHNAVNDMFDVMGYSATLNGEGNIFLPTIDFGWVYTDEDPSGPSPLGIPSGPLEFSLFANLYSGPYVVHESSSVGENDAVRLYAFRHYGGATQVRNQNTIQLEVKFADQDDSAYVPYSFVVTLVPGAGCGDPENDGDWVCVTP